MNLETDTDLAERQRACPAQIQQHQRFVAREGQFERAERLVQAGQPDLLNAHHRRHRHHRDGRRRAPVLAPLAASLLDGIKGE